MKNFEFESQICTTKEQSEKLLALGLKKKTADMYYPMELEGELPKIADSFFGPVGKSLPAWSLHRLVEMIPFTIWHTEHENSPRLEHTFWFSKYAPNYNSNEDIDFREYPNLYDNIIDCIEWLINEGYFNKNYLEEKQ